MSLVQKLFDVPFDRRLLGKVTVANEFNLESIHSEEKKEFVEALNDMDNLPDGVDTKTWVKTYEAMLGEVADVVVTGCQYYIVNPTKDVFEGMTDEDKFELEELLTTQAKAIGFIVDYKLQRTLFRNKYDYYGKKGV
jgi:hypothetical protein